MQEKETIIDKLGKVISIAGNAIGMNLLFLVSCIPIVTIGQAWCGLLSAVRYNIRGDKWFDGFKAGFKTRFWRGTIAWCIMLLIDVYALLDINHTYAAEAVVPLVGACIMFALAIMVTLSLQILNVYVPTRVGDWVRNAVNMVFKVPLELLAAAVLCWLPVLLFVLWTGVFAYSVTIFIAVYFTLAAVCATLVLKNALIFYLLQARTDGTLIADEGKKKPAAAADDEDEEDDQDEEEDA